MNHTLPRALILATCLAGLLGVGGCSCWKDPLAQPTQTKKPKKPETLEEMEAARRELLEKQKEKPDFETVRLAVLPDDDARTKNQVKPGHWFSAVQTMKANNFDFSKGELESQCVDTRGNPIKLPNTEFELSTTRPVSLPEGQQKHFDLLLFASMPGGGTINFMTRLRPRGGGREVDWKYEAATRMKPFQNHLIVLAERADNYQFLKAMRSVRPERSGDLALDSAFDYFVKLPKGTRRIDVPAHPLTWSNVAYVVWDDFDPEILSGDQQQAMIDWLHWGGQLIVNGPRTLDRLQSSVFATYLPARAGSVGVVTDEQIAELNRHWSFSDLGGNPLTVPDDKERPVAVELTLAPAAHFVETTGGTLAEKYVGRGRVVATSFNLPHTVFLAWDSYDSFFNSCLLGRPAREFHVPHRQRTVVEDWSGTTLQRDDARTTSAVRYFSRDAMAMSTRSKQRRTTSQQFEPSADVADEFELDVVETDEQQPHALSTVTSQAFGVNGFAKDDLVGVAGWSDQSDVSRAARESLEQSAGISVPSINFIAKVLGIYLAILVPLNWIVFRLMGRVEWAWAMVPLIAVGGALGVVQAAQLDIGFARSRTEIAVVELQPNYDRAHVTRYIGFYTSLTSRYQVAGTDDSTLLQPLSSSQPVGDRRVALHQGNQVNLSGFSILSNSTGMVHGEQMADLGGIVTLADESGRLVLRNDTDFDLRGAAVVRRAASGVVEVAWVGDVGKKERRSDIRFERLTGKLVEFEQWERLPATSQESSEGDLNIRGLIEIATDPKRLGREEAVLVGWNDQIMPGIAVQPHASQVTARTLFVAQLAHAQRPEPHRDENSFAVLNRQTKQDAEDDDYLGDL